ncbi:TetR family transcriptional regulator [Chromatiales bacterium (ex Bugula neritina AB1)]|nr:TetR family transcriptional regulator [Chromatiales bacterium (ex Bugula neritina AB1)]
MQPTSIRALRRTELSRAAFEAVVQYGLRKTTLDKVGEIAGVSKGVVLHHFKDKSTLLEAVFRQSNTLLSDSFIELCSHAEDPYERLWAIVVANFSGTIFNRRVCQAWVALLGEVAHNEHCQRVQTACNARIYSNLCHELKHFLNKADTTRSAHQLSLLIDGIWVRGGLQAEPLTSAAAISDMEYAILNLLPADTESTARHHEARRKMENVGSILLGSKAYKEKAFPSQ